MLKKYTHTYKRAIMLLCILISGIVITACNNDDDGIGNITQLNSFGPSPALRGGDLRFIGVNLDKVTTIILPGNVEVTSFKEKTSSLIVIEVPEETVEGKVILKTSNGDIETKTILGISEPITIESIEPIVVRPGDVITIKGTYLNLIDKVAFSDNKVVADFESQSKSEIKVKVPHDAQTGNLILITPVEDEGEIPIEVVSEVELEVILPEATSLSPNPVKAGDDLTIKGTDLNLATAIVFVGGSRVEQEDFELTEEGDIVVKVPSNAQDGKIKLVAPSLVEAESSEELTMVEPTIGSVSGISSNLAKNGGNITVIGTDLDLITSVTFGGEKSGEILDGGTATEITVKVPKDAAEDVVTFGTDANKSIATEDILTLVKPMIASVSPATVKTMEDITIDGEDLDLVAQVIFSGDVEGAIVTSSETQLIVTVPPRSESGTISLVMTNGDEIESSQSLTIEAGNVPTVTSMPATAKPGEMITIEGTKLDLAVDIIFPNNVKATTFGVKTATKLEVVVPAEAEIGTGRITFVTIIGEITESPQINIVGDIAYYIYDDALSSDWQKWDGWGTSEQDMANTEHVKKGSSAIKVIYNSDSWGAFQLHPLAPETALDGYTTLVLSIYGGDGSDGQSMAISGKNAAQVEFAGTTITVVEGEYTTFEIPFADLGNPDGIYELWIKNNSADAYTVYLDEIGLR